MAKYDMSEKDEFLILLRNIEKMMRVSPSMLLDSPDYAEKIQRFNSLVSLVPSFRLSEGESKEVQRLWKSLKHSIEQRAKKVAADAQLTPQERLLQILKNIIRRWGTASRDEKKEFIKEAHRLQLDQSVMAKMSTEQIREYRELIETIRGMATIEQISLEEQVKRETSERRRLGL